MRRYSHTVGHEQDLVEVLQLLTMAIRSVKKNAGSADSSIADVVAKAMARLDQQDYISHPGLVGVGNPSDQIRV